MNEVDGRECTALFWAARKGHEKVVKVLLQHSACVDQADDEGTTPLAAAAFAGHARFGFYWVMGRTSIKPITRVYALFTLRLKRATRTR